MYSQEGLEYLYLFLVKELGRDAQDNQYVPMSFFCTTNYRYLQNQTVYNVLDVKITPFQKRPKNKKSSRIDRYVHPGCFSFNYSSASNP